MNEKHVEMGRIIERDILKPLLNFLSYPIAGNLPLKYQEKIQQATNGIYDPEDAFQTTLVTNPVMYTLGGISLGIHFFDFDGAKFPAGALGFVWAAGYTAIENLFRSEMKKEHNDINASLPFFVATMPFRVCSALKYAFNEIADEAEENIENRRQIADITHVTDAEYCGLDKESE